MAKLHWKLGEASGEVVLDGAITFGRGAENALVLSDPNISAVHAAIERGGDGRWRVVDRGSTNGLLWGGVRKSEIPLVDGTEFSAGDVKFRFTEDALQPPPGGLAKTTVMPIPVGAPEAREDSTSETAAASAAASPRDPSPAAVAPPASPPVTASPPSAGVPLWKRPIVVAVGLVLVAGLLWFLGRRSATEPGMPVFASEAQKEVVRLRGEMESPVYSTRWSAYNRLKARGEAVDPVPLWLLDLKSHPDDDYREEAAKKLGKRKDPRAIPQLRASKESDPDWNVRRAAGNALEEMGIEK